MPPICISSTRFILSGRAIVTVERAFHVAAAHRAAERPFRGEALEAGDLVFAAKRLARGGDDPGDAILRRQAARYEMPIDSESSDATITIAAVEITLRMSAPV